MLLLIKKKYGFCKTFRQDIWGLFLINLLSKNYTNKYVIFFAKLYIRNQSNRYKRFKRYVYRLDIVDPAPKRKRFRKEFFDLRLHVLFYVTLEHKQFFRMRRSAAKKDGYFQYNFFHLLEGRVVSIVYRSNFFSDMFDSIKHVREGFVWVNKRINTYVNSVISVGDLYGIFPSYVSRQRFIIARRLLSGAVVFTAPRFLHVNYNLLFAMFLSKPSMNDLVFPFRFNISRIQGYSL